MLYGERNEVLRALYKRSIDNQDVKNIAYVDESGIDHAITREYGWGKRGEPLMGERSGKAYGRTSMVAGLCNKQILAPLCFSGHTDRELFLHWLEFCLLPELKPGQVVVMDNASWHKSQKVIEILGRKNCTAFFLPAYSPDLNPIEYYWSWLKAKVRCLLDPHTRFTHALYSAFCLDYSSTPAPIRAAN